MVLGYLSYLAGYLLVMGSLAADDPLIDGLTVRSAGECNPRIKNRGRESPASGGWVAQVPKPVAHGAYGFR